MNETRSSSLEIPISWDMCTKIISDRPAWRCLSTETSLCTPQTLKRKSLHFDEIFITGCTGSCQNDNFQCSQWLKLRQNDDIFVSVNGTTITTSWRRFDVIMTLSLRRMSARTLQQQNSSAISLDEKRSCIPALHPTRTIGTSSEAPRISGTKSSRAFSNEARLLTSKHKRMTLLPR